jgi:DNA helicase-2/ATP-dependent DNA helicase PcrA
MEWPYRGFGSLEWIGAFASENRLEFEAFLAPVMRCFDNRIRLGHIDCLSMARVGRMLARRNLKTFPLRAACDPKILTLADRRNDYPAIQSAAVGLLNSGAVDEIIAASYSRIVVDEYQDCGTRQQLLIVRAAKTLPACVLGDPLQAIFTFGDALPAWASVCEEFPLIGELAIPWRWKNAGADDLGEWLLDARRRLLDGKPISLRGAPRVTWIELNGTSANDRPKQLAAASAQAPGVDGHTLIIGDSTSPQSQQQFAKQIPGAVTVEAVDLQDLVAFAATFDLAAQDALARLADFAQSVMTNVGAANLLQRVRSLANGTARKLPNDVETAALAFARAPSFSNAVNLLIEISKEPGVHRHRPTVLRACIKAMQLCSNDNAVSLHDAAIQVREEGRLIGRSLPKRAVGSTLLLKGLEAVSVILNADGINARDLYVAMTRGSEALVICSRRDTLSPSP